jgi:hypothetical protein
MATNQPNPPINPQPQPSPQPHPPRNTPDRGDIKHIEPTTPWPKK